MKTTSVQVKRLHESAAEIANQLYELASAAYPGGSPWKVLQFATDLTNSQTVYLGAFKDQQLLGFISYQQLFDEVEITNVAVHEAFKGQGIGKTLVEHLLTTVATVDFDTRIFLEVRESNRVAQQLYRHFGFEMINRRKKYYHNPIEDAYIMMRQVPKQKKE